jgi:hypothetical protein
LQSDTTGLVSKELGRVFSGDCGALCVLESSRVGIEEIRDAVGVSTSSSACAFLQYRRQGKQRVFLQLV